MIWVMFALGVFLDCGYSDNKQSKKGKENVLILELITEHSEKTVVPGKFLLLCI